MGPCTDHSAGYRRLPKGRGQSVPVGTQLRRRRRRQNSFPSGSSRTCHCSSPVCPISAGRAPISRRRSSSAACSRSVGLMSMCSRRSPVLGWFVGLKIRVGCSPPNSSSGPISIAPSSVPELRQPLRIQAVDDQFGEARSHACHPRSGPQVVPVPQQHVAPPTRASAADDGAASRLFGLASRGRLFRRSNRRMYEPLNRLRARLFFKMQRISSGLVVAGLRVVGWAVRPPSWPQQRFVTATATATAVSHVSRCCAQRPVRRR